MVEIRNVLSKAILKGGSSLKDLETLMGIWDTFRCTLMFMIEGRVVENKMLRICKKDCSERKIIILL